jgi:hypothetical protein
MLSLDEGWLLDIPRRTIIIILLWINADEEKTRGKDPERGLVLTLCFSSLNSSF